MSASVLPWKQVAEIRVAVEHLFLSAIPLKQDTLWRSLGAEECMTQKLRLVSESAVRRHTITPRGQRSLPAYVDTILNVHDTIPYLLNVSCYKDMRNSLQQYSEV